MLECLLITLLLCSFFCIMFQFQTYFKKLNACERTLLNLNISVWPPYHSPHICLSEYVRLYKYLKRHWPFLHPFIKSHWIDLQEHFCGHFLPKNSKGQVLLQFLPKRTNWAFFHVIKHVMHLNTLMRCKKKSFKPCLTICFNSEH